MSAQLRLSDADRQQVLDVLSEHYAEGRLTREEFDERSDAVWSAKTHGDLSPIFADLPGGASAGSSPRTPDRPLRHAVGPVGRRGFRAGRILVPVFLVLLAITILTHLPVVLIALFIGFLLFSRGPRHWQGRHWAHAGAHTSGNRFEARGSCW